MGKHSLVVFACCLVLSPAGSVSAVEHLAINRGGDTAYLPYRLDVVRSTPVAPDEPRVNRTSQVLVAARAVQSGSFVTVYNSKEDDDGPAIVNLNRFPVIQHMKDTPLWMTVRDYQVYRDTLARRPACAIAGFQRDSAFIYRVFPETGETDHGFLMHGYDSVATGNGIWEPSIDVLTVTDYDFDSLHEAFVYVDSRHEGPKRTLVCVELERLEVEWVLPVASVIRPYNILASGDPEDPALFFTAYNPKNGKSDSVFSDLFAYLTKVDTTGRIVFNHICADQHLDCRLALDHSGQQLYLTHQLDIAPKETPWPDAADMYRISVLDFDGVPRTTRETSDRPYVVYLRDHPPTGQRLLHVVFQEGFQRIYDTGLNVVAESDSVGRLTFLGRIKIAGQHDTAIVFDDGIYSQDLERLAAFPEPVSSFQVLGYDADGNAQSIIAHAASLWIFNIEKKGFTELLGVFYVRNQRIILIILTALVVAVVLVNYYRRKNRSAMILIAQQRDELAKTHQALKDAQATIIEQEKYRQAKGIAGGFAHEIRNALFPAEAAVGRLSAEQPDRSALEKRARYLKTITSAVNRALDLTELISRYTKLDSEYMPETVDLRRVIQEVIQANQMRIEEEGVTVDCRLADDVTVEGNARQFQSVFGNLLLNSLDALTGVDNPRITFEASVAEDLILVTVADNGSGIDPEQLPHVFEAFFSTKPDTGTGLGLAITKKIVEMYGGQITVTSEPERGTYFTIELKPHRGGRRE